MWNAGLYFALIFGKTKAEDLESELFLLCKVAQAQLDCCKPNMYTSYQILQIVFTSFLLF